MALEGVIDSVRRIIHKWVNTVSPIAQNVSAGSSIIYVNNVRRFSIGDQVMLKNNTHYETGLTIDEIDSDNNKITLSDNVLNDWVVSSSTVLIKTINEQFVQGIYFGDPDVIPRYPAITVNGTSRASEWMTLESTKERYELEIGVFVKDSTHEAGYRFLLNIVDTIQKGLKRNIMPLILDGDFISLNEDASQGDFDIKISDQSKLANFRRIIIEDQTNYQESWVDYVYDDGETIKLSGGLIADFNADETSIIVPHRFIFNSWPATINYGKVHKGELLKAATISWFAEEEEMQYQRREEGKIY